MLKGITKEVNGDNTDKGHLLRFEIKITQQFLKKAFRELDHMNINHATLFPGLAGYTTNLKNIVLYKKVIE
jgi:hypothetical protein